MADKPEFALEDIVKQLRVSWSGSTEGSYRSWTDASITYSIPVSRPAGTTGRDEELTGFVPPTANQIRAAQEAFAVWADLIDKPLILTTDPGANITVAWSSGTGGRAYSAPEIRQTSNPFDFTGPVTYAYVRDSIWISDQWSNLRDEKILLGTHINYAAVDGFYVLVHEIGHALGLSHPGPYNDTDMPKPTYEASAVFAQDTRQYTVMSYFGGNLQGTGWTLDGPLSFFPSTPMVFDIAAIQAIYGANPNTRQGNTTYGFNVTADVPDVLDFSKNVYPVVTIYDAGGIDTLDLSPDVPALDANGAVQVDSGGIPQRIINPQFIDLTPGAYSSVMGMKDNLAIALNTSIEHAIGGRYADTIIGNGADNALTGNAGNDIIDGKAGHDTLTGNAGADSLHGGAGNDSLDGGDDADTLGGGSGRDQLLGGAGNDSMEGGTGDDGLAGQRGDDTVRGGDGADSLLGGIGNDLVAGGKGSDMLTGDDPESTVRGADTFVFARGDGDDLIADFEPGQDRVDLTGVNTVFSFDMLMDRATDLLGGLQVDFGGGDTLTFFGITRDQLKPGMFQFSEAPPEGGDFAIEGTAVSALPGGGFIVVWSPNTTFTNAGGEIMARIHDADGIGGAAFQVNNTTFGHQYAPKVVMQANGNFVVAWSSIETTWPGPQYDAGEQWLRARVFTPDGTPLGDDFRLNTTPHPGTIPVFGNQYLGVGGLAPWGEDGFAAVWGSNDPQGIYYDTVIRSRVVAGDGTRSGTDSVLADPHPPNTLTFQGDGYASPRIVHHDGDAIVAFFADEYPDVAAPGAILSVRFADGQPPSPITALASTPHPNRLPYAPAFKDYQTEFELVPFRDDDYLMVASGVLRGNANTQQGAGYGNQTRYFVEYRVITNAGIGETTNIFLDEWRTGSITQGVAATRLADGRVMLAFGDGTATDSNIQAVVINRDESATRLRDLSGWPSDTVFPGDGAKYTGDAAGLEGGGAVATWFNVSPNGGTLTDSPRAIMLNADLKGVTLGGTPDADTLTGSGYDDRITGAGGDDVLVGRAGADTLDGRDGRDTADYALSLFAVRVDLEEAVQGGGNQRNHARGDVLISIENLSGSAYDDGLYGDAGNNSLSGSWGEDYLAGRDGDDTLAGGADADVLLGDDGIDTADYSASSAGVRVDLGSLAAQVSGGDADGDRLEGIENLIGSAFADTLIGDAGANVLVGNGGNDVLDGGPDVAARLASAAIDAVVYAGPASRYRVVVEADGRVTVRDSRIGQPDSTGVDRLIGIEEVRFADRIIDLAAIIADARPPVARPDTIIVSGPTTFTAAQLLANDSDPDGTSVTLSALYGPSDGTLDEIDAASGSWRFTPPASGTSFYADYEITDEAGNTGYGIVWFVTPSPPGTGPNSAPVAAADSALLQDFFGRLYATGNLLDNDRDADGDVLFVDVASITAPTKGRLTDIGADGVFDYIADVGFTGTDSFTYDVIDGKGGRSTATVTITLPPPNAAPTDVALTRTTTAPALPAGALVAKLSAIDADAGDTHVFSFAAGGNPGGLFTIEDDRLLAASALDYPNGARLALTIRATDAAGATFDKPVFIDVGGQFLAAPGGGVLAGRGGDDIVQGQAGDDALFGREGDDTITGAGGADTVQGQGGADSLSGGEGDDAIRAGTGHDTAMGDAGRDMLAGQEGDDSLAGGLDADLLLGGLGADTLRGGEGEDTLRAAEGDDLAEGEKGADLLLGLDGADTLRGGAGRDTLSGGAGDDRLEGGAGSDLLRDGAGADTIEGGADDGTVTLIGLGIAQRAVVRNGDVINLRLPDGDPDLILYTAGRDGVDQVLGFEAGIDRISVTLDGATADVRDLSNGTWIGFTDRPGGILVQGVGGLSIGTDILFG